MLSCFTVHWLWREFFLRPQRTADSHGVITCIAELQVFPTPEPLSRFNGLTESVIEALNGPFAAETLEINPKDAIIVPSGSQVTGQGKLQTFFSSFILSWLSVWFSPPSYFTLKILYNAVWCLDDLAVTLTGYGCDSERKLCCMNAEFLLWLTDQIKCANFISNAGIVLRLFQVRAVHCCFLNIAALQFCRTL